MQSSLVLRHTGPYIVEHSVYNRMLVYNLTGTTYILHYMQWRFDVVGKLAGEPHRSVTPSLPPLPIPPPGYVNAVAIQCQTLSWFAAGTNTFLLGSVSMFLFVCFFIIRDGHIFFKLSSLTYTDHILMMDEVRLLNLNTRLCYV